MDLRCGPLIWLVGFRDAPIWGYLGPAYPPEGWPIYWGWRNLGGRATKTHSAMPTRVRTQRPTKSVRRLIRPVRKFLGMTDGRKTENSTRGGFVFRLSNSWAFCIVPLVEIGLLGDRLTHSGIRNQGRISDF